ncbi:MAG TPA: efflux RND transporter periplasmic adaptor subunit [Nevskia sp.]|jgi:RND family efflux transporter MFP subunit|nr:efflux RND transporter periplasmic adaptor subunit [Nevskia sp.]
MPEHDTNNAAPANARRYAIVILVVVLVLAAWGIMSRIHARADLRKQAADAAIPTVTVIQPSHGPATEELTLPGSVQAWYEAPIYARTSGYLKSWVTDIGVHVKRGQLLAEIDAPDVDQQYRQAQADLGTAQANLQLSDITNTRWQGLLATDSVSKQDADEKAGDLAAKKATEQSAAANLARLRELEGFKRVVAPFDGVVTLRNTDIGNLINAGEASGTELFHVADTHALRVYVQVPQPYAASAGVGTEAELAFADHPGKLYPAKVIATADALDPAARTLQVQLELDNPKGELFPGSYAEVHFKLTADALALRVPANTLLFRSAGLQVGTVSANDVVALKSVSQGRDFGSSVEILNGLKPDDRIVLNPPDSLEEGQKVHVAPPPKPPAGQDKGQQGGQPGGKPGDKKP